MTVEIKLTKGYVAIVDDCDADLAELKWWITTRQAQNVSQPYYAARSNNSGVGKKTIYMHVVILERILGYSIPVGYTADHIDNKSPLNNCRSNLRLATHQQNTQNRDRNANGSGPYKGVTAFNRKKKPWFVQIRINDINTYIGTFADPLEGHRAYCIAALTHFGEFANFGSNSPFAGMTLEQLQEPVIQLALLMKDAA